MGIFITKQEVARLRNADQNCLQSKCYQALKNRVYKDTRENTLVQSGDTQEWYHLCWERLSDVSFIYHVEQNPELGTWLHDRTMEIVHKSMDEWIGPWYRERMDDPQKQEGYLETSHIVLAVCEAVDNCPELFTEQEMQECLEAIREKGMILCARYCDTIFRKSDIINNWFIVVLDGFGTVAALLKEQEYIRKAVEYSHIAASLYNKDSYGESIQYSSYATIHLSHMNEVLIRSGLVDMEELELQCYGNLVTWYAASLLYSKPLERQGPSYPRTVNFGDSAAIYRPPGDVLVQVASRLKDIDKRASGLASWMFETVYTDPFLGPNELASLGLYNQFQYFSVLRLPDCAAPASPEESRLPEVMSFECGQIIARDSWIDTKAIVAIQAGYQPYNVTAHRHKDQNSFQLTYGGERFLVDPGHCCYRLRIQAEAVSEMAHNTITLKKDGKIVEQRQVRGSVFQRADSDNKLLVHYSWGSVQLVASDIAGLYDENVEKAVRVWVMNLPHQVLTVDIVKTKEDMSLCTHFCLNNRDNGLREHHYSDQRLVLRRGGQALKLFEVYSMTDGREVLTKFDFDWTAMHTYYHPLPNQDGQGKEGSVKRYHWEDWPGKEHIRIHTFVMDSSEEIVHWHVYPIEDGYVRMENAAGDAWIDVKAQMNQVIIRNDRQNEEYISF